MHRVTIYSAHYGNPALKRVEREVTYRWRWMARLHSMIALAPHRDPRIARWCEITHEPYPT
jgi:hypothetical protein